MTWQLLHSGCREWRLASLLALLSLAACTRFGFDATSADGRTLRGDGALPGDGARDASLPLIKGHPRLYFSEAEVPALLAKTKRTPYQDSWTTLKQLADASICQSTIPDWAAVKNAAKALRYPAFVYALTKDKAYGDKAKQCLLAAAAWPRWQSDDIAEAIGWDTGIIHGAVAECYDWVYPLLSAAERQQVLEAMVTKSLAVAQSFSSTAADETYFKGSPDGAQLWSGPGLVVLAALGDDPRVASYYQLVHDRMQQWVFDYYTSEGSYGQSLTSMIWGLTTEYSGGALWYAEALKHVGGEDLYAHPNFVKAYQFPLYWLPPDYKSESSSFGDQEADEHVPAGVIGAFASRQGSPYAQWYYHHGPAPLDRAGLQTILFYEDSLPERDPAELPLAKHFPGTGWVAMRTSWAEGDTLVGFKHTPVRWRDERGDHNAFFIDALGERLVVNASFSSQTIADPSYSSYYRATVGANTLLLDGDPASQDVWPDDPAISYGRIISTTFTPQYDYVRSEAAPAYKGKLSKFERRLVFVKPNKVGYVVIYDQVTSSSGNHRYDFLVHALGSSSISTVPPSEATIARNQARVAIKVLSPTSPSLAVQAGKPIYFEGNDQATSYLRTSTASSTASATFLVVLFPYPSSSSAPTISLAPSGAGAQVSRPGTSSPDTVLFKSDGTVDVALGS